MPKQDAIAEEQAPKEQAQDKAELTHDQQHEAESRVAVSAHVVHEAIRLQGEDELKRPVSALAWSGLAAGLSMGFSLITEGVIARYLPDQPWRPLLVKLGYPFGFLLVILGRQQLFTENTLTAIIPLLAKKDLKTLGCVARLWITVLLSNLVGAHVIAWVLANTAMFPPEVRNRFLELGQEAAAVGFGTALLRGIFAGWLIATVVWLLAAMQSERIRVIVILTYVVGLGGFTHVVAGSVDVLFLVMSGLTTWWAYLGGYLVPALIGNVVGGVSLVSALNHAQVVSGKAEQR